MTPASYFNFRLTWDFDDAPAALSSLNTPNRVNVPLLVFEFLGENEIARMPRWVDIYRDYDHPLTYTRGDISSTGLQCESWHLQNVPILNWISSGLSIDRLLTFFRSPVHSICGISTLASSSRISLCTMLLAGMVARGSLSWSFVVSFSILAKVPNFCSEVPFTVVDTRKALEPTVTVGR